MYLPCVWRSENIPRNPFLSFYHVDSEGQTQAISFDKHHLTHTVFILEVIFSEV